MDRWWHDVVGTWIRLIQVGAGGAPSGCSGQVGKLPAIDGAVCELDTTSRAVLQLHSNLPQQPKQKKKKVTATFFVVKSVVCFYNLLKRCFDVGK